MDGWIVIPNWERFQHYSDRDPVWIKVYTELNSRAEWLDLTDAERGLLVTIWLEYARSDGRLRVARVPAAGHQKNRRRGLERLIHAGFIQVSASKPLALARAGARSLETEREKDINPKAVMKGLTSREDDNGQRPLGFNIPADLLKDMPR